MIPGFVFAQSFVIANQRAWFHLALGFIATCLVASANYVINEYLDRDFDRFHPTKKNRPSVFGKVNPNWVAFEYTLLLFVGIGIGTIIGTSFAITLAGLAVMGVIYNVKPIRSKDVVYLDVLSESINNPLRLLLGWFVVFPYGIPPSSLLLSYWMAGAFLMGLKRFAEIRGITDKKAAALYRRSFGRYTEDSLLISAFFYALCAAFFGAVFLVKYRMELVVLVPFVAVVFAWYLKIALKPNSAAQKTERLYREQRFIIYVGFVFILLIFLMKFDFPSVAFLSERNPIRF